MQSSVGSLKPGVGAFQGSTARADGIAAKSPDQCEGVLDAIGRAGDGARAWAVQGLHGL